MGEMRFRLEDLFQEEDTNEEVDETEAITAQSSYFNNICININNMTNSSINLGNVRRSRSKSNNRSLGTPNPITRRNPIAKPSPIRPVKNKKYNGSKSQNATLKVTFPGMIQKKHGPK